MQAVLIDDFKGPEAAYVGSLAAPVLQEDQLLVRIAAAGVNPADWKACAGWLPFLSQGFPLVPGFDGAGTVIACGSSTSGFVPGDRIAFMSAIALGAQGSWAEEAVCTAAHAAKIPDALSFEVAAAVPVAGISAREALTQAVVKPGEKVLVNGGAGGTGSFAIQIARMAGASVAATAGPANQQLLRQLGADLSIDYTEGQVEEAVLHWAPKGVDLLLDTVGQNSLADPSALIREGGQLIAIETMIPDEPRPDADRLGARGISYVRASADFLRLGEHLRALLTAIADGSIGPPPIETMPIARAAEAMVRVRAGHVRGKLILSAATGSDWNR